MKKRHIIAILSVILVGFTAYADEKPAATVFSLQGTATIERNGSSLQAVEAMVVTPGDEVIVGDPGRVALELPDGSYIRLAGGSRMRFPKAEKSVGLVAGAMHFFSHSEQHPTVVTEHVTAAIRGTEFTLKTDVNGTTVSMLSGFVEGQSSNGSASLSGGQGALFAKGKRPAVYALLQSDRSVQWSAFIPLLEENDSDTPETRKALMLAAAGKTAAALEMAPTSRAGCGTSDLTRARILLTSGDVSVGRSLLQRCATTASDTNVRANAAAILSLVELSRGDSAAANANSQKAVELLPNSPQALFARSLALQDQGNLDEALAVVSSGSTDDLTLTARKAELLFMFGRVPEARHILENLPQRSWYSDAVLGFVLMGDRDFDRAEEAFLRAAQEQPAAGLPQVGLGIVEVNKGNLTKGREFFERATVLEPSRSTYRSYLAKSYFEADTYQPAEPEYERAIELDSNDPTPYLYRSFMRIAQNRPVDALHDLETARDLSDKRSVYRSKFLLDEDSAVQSASLSRVYRELGFEQRGRIEAITAIYDDYENASAHRLLSETQSLVFNATSSLSERRISDLFAPLSINVADSIGTSVSLNEYSSLLERDGWRTGVNAGYSSYDDTFVTGVISANKTGNLLTGLSATGVGTDGFIHDPRGDEGRVGISFQGQPTWADRFLVEARGTFLQDKQTDENNDVNSGTAAGSYLHRFSPDTTAVVQTSYRRGRDRISYPNNPSDIVIDDTNGSFIDSFEVGTSDRQADYETAIENEAQLIDKRGPVTSIITGRFSHYDSDLSDKAEVVEDPSEILQPGTLLRSQGSNGLNASSVSYLSTIDTTNSLKLNLGGEWSSVEFVSNDQPPYSTSSESNSKITPKAGILFQPSERMLLRTGYGEYLGRATQEALVSLEPTLIGGITQRYRDILPGTQAKTWGSGIDLKPFQATYLGSEWNRRWLDQPLVESFYDITVDPTTGEGTLGQTSTQRVNGGIQQDFVSTYLYQVINNNFVVGSDYRYAMSTADQADDATLRDHLGKGFARYFFTNMFFVQTAANYRYQGRINNPVVPNGTSSGWTFDAALGYRLPTRQGVITAGVKNILGQNFDLVQYDYFNELTFNDPTVELAARFNF
jgi:tetratricopeptide (TPR) repeat protein